MDSRLTSIAHRLVSIAAPALVLCAALLGMAILEFPAMAFPVFLGDHLWLLPLIGGGGAMIAVVAATILIFRASSRTPRWLWLHLWQSLIGYFLLIDVLFSWPNPFPDRPATGQLFMSITFAIVLGNGLSLIWLRRITFPAPSP